MFGSLSRARAERRAALVRRRAALAVGVSGGVVALLVGGYLLVQFVPPLLRLARMKRM